LIQERLLRLPIFYKILIGNSLIIIVGAIGGTWLTKELIDDVGFALVMFFVACGIVLSIFVNFFVLKSALKPLANLQHTVEQVYRGNTQVRANLDEASDPELARLAAALNTMLDRLAAHARTIEAHRQQLRILSGQILSAQEDERKRIARELHDETSQALTTLLINIEMAQSAIPATHVATREKLVATYRLAERILEGVRELVFALRPTMLDDLGLAPAIHWYAKNYLEPAGVQVFIETARLDKRLPPQVETALFRIAQEAMNNIVKHAQARTARIRLVTDDSHAVLTVEDDGRGFDVEAVLRSTDKEQKLGLFGIQERVALLGGTFTLDSRPSQGTRLVVKAPL